MQLFPAESYQAEIAQRYADVAARLGILVPEARIEHIGASAVPGALSKGDLDVCLVVETARLEAVVRRLKAEGYVEQTDTLRTEHLCMLVWAEPERAHAVQLVAEGTSFMDFMTFRDQLRSRPALAAAYNRVKLESAGLGESGYREAKSRFIAEVLASAEKSG